MFKALPISELAVVAVLFRAGDDDEGRPDFEEEVLNQKLYDAGTFEPFDKALLRCDCCGNRLKYACKVVHQPTLKGYYVGRACASKIDTLRNYVGHIEQASVALAERAACKAREISFRATQPADVGVALDWAASPAGSRFAQDLRAKLRRYGEMSPAQIAALLRGHQEHLNKLAIAATGVKVPTGRVQLRGVISSLKDTPEPARYGGVTHHWKMVLDLGNSVRVWGTCPEGIAPADYLPPGDTKVRAGVGRTVTLTATVEASAKDPLFGYFSRPSKAAVEAPAI